MIKLTFARDEMRNFDYANRWQNLLTPDIVSLLTQIHEFKGEQTLFVEAKADTLSQLMEMAKIQSTEASNKIEGIFTSDERLKKIVRDKTMPKNRNERNCRLQRCFGHHSRKP